VDSKIQFYQIKTLKEIEAIKQVEEQERQKEIMYWLASSIRFKDDNAEEGFIREGPSLLKLNPREVPSPRITKESLKPI